MLFPRPRFYPPCCAWEASPVGVWRPPPPPGRRGHVVSRGGHKYLFYCVPGPVEGPPLKWHLGTYTRYSERLVGRIPRRRLPDPVESDLPRDHPWHPRRLARPDPTQVVALSLHTLLRRGVDIPGLSPQIPPLPTRPLVLHDDSTISNTSQYHTHHLTSANAC